MKKSKKKTTIKLANFLTRSISSRDVANMIKEIVVKESSDSIDLDFSKIEFISRSAAHEFLRMKIELFYLSQSKDIFFVNTDENVTEMLRIVAANRAVPKKRDIDFNPKEVSIVSILKQLTSC